MKSKQSIGPYIWQSGDWPNFRWRSEDIIDLLSRISQLQGRLAGRMDLLGFKEKSRSILSSISNELISSYEIEGVYLNPHSVRSSVARRLSLDYAGLPEEDHYVDGLVEIMVDATENCRMPLTEERLFSWHAAIFPTGRSGIYKIRTGGWREGKEAMQVISGTFGKEKVHYEAPPAEKIPEMMSQFIEACNNLQYSPIVMAALSHLWFVTIHPFADGNGRISRILSDYFLSRLDVDGFRHFSMSEAINRNKKEYYAILEKTQKGTMDVTEWILWFLHTLENAIENSLKVLDRILDKSKFWTLHGDLIINERQRKVLNKLLDGFEGKLTSSKWARIGKCSQDTALRDINDLLIKGILIKGEGGGRNVHYILSKV